MKMKGMKALDRQPLPGKLDELFDKSRDRLNKKKKRGWLYDYMFTAPPFTSRYLRFLANLPLGFAFGLAFYMLLMDDLLFNSVEPGLQWVIQYTVVFLIALSFAWSPVLRTVMWCSIFTLLSSSGQEFVTAYLMSMVFTAVLPNMMGNFELASDSLLCNLHVASELASERTRLAAEPIKDLVIDLGGGAAETRRVMGIMDELYRPILQEQTQLKEEIDLLNLEKRYNQLVNSKVDGASSGPEQNKSWGALQNGIQNVAYSGVKGFMNLMFGDDGAEKPGPDVPTVVETNKTRDNALVFKRLKSDIAKHYAYKLRHRCQAIFDASVVKCLDNTAPMLSACQKQLGKSEFILFRIPIVTKYLCKSLVVDKMCRFKNTEAAKRRMCEDQTAGSDGISQLISPSLDLSLQESMDASNLISDEMKVDVYFKMVEQPRALRVMALDDIKLSMALRMDWMKSLIQIIQVFLKLLVIMLTFKAINLATEFTKKYMEDVTFQNYYTCRYFWRVDARQQREKRSFLRRLKRYEKREHGLLAALHPLPSGDEMGKVIVAFIKFVMIGVSVGAIFLTDYGVYRALDFVSEHQYTEARQGGDSEFSLSVQGTGKIAKMVRSMLTSFNKTGELSQSVDNAHCSVKPTPLDVRHYHRAAWLLLVMFVGQVLLTYGILRFRLLGLMPFMWPQRHKARILSLYNRLLRTRKTSNDLAKQKIRQLTRERELNRMPEGSFFEFLENLGLLKAKCYLCSDKFKAKKLKECPATGLAERNRGAAYDFTEYSTLYDETKAAKYCYCCFVLEREEKAARNQETERVQLSEYKGVADFVKKKADALKEKVGDAAANVRGMGQDAKAAAVMRM